MRGAGSHTDQPGPAAQRGLRRQHNGTAAAMVAADAQHMAIAPFVAIARTQRQTLVQGIGTKRQCRRCNTRPQRLGQVQCRQLQFPAMIQGHAGAQATVPGQELHRHISQNGHTRRMPAARIDAAGHIQ